MVIIVAFKNVLHGMKHKFTSTLMGLGRAIKKNGNELQKEIYSKWAIDLMDATVVSNT